MAEWILIGHIHIHIDPEESSWSYIGDEGSDLLTIQNHPGMKFFLMNTNKKLFGLRANGLEFRSLRGLNDYNVDDLLNGKLKLIPFILKY